MMDKITISEIIKAFMKSSGLSKKEATKFVDTLQILVEEALLCDKIVKISSLGTFKLILVEPRKSVDVASGLPIEIGGHYKVNFIPDTDLKNQVNAPLAHLETVNLDDVDSSVEDILPADDDAVAQILTQSKPNEFSADGVVENNEDINDINDIEDVDDNDPLKRLAAEAIGLQSLLSEIQGANLFASAPATIDTPLPTIDTPQPNIVEEDLPHETIAEEETPINIAKSVESEASSHTQSIEHVEFQKTVAATEPVVAAEPEPQVQVSVQCEPVEIKDDDRNLMSVIESINQENSGGRFSNLRWLWITLLIVLPLGAICLLLYFNRDFVANLVSNNQIVLADTIEDKVVALPVISHIEDSVVLDTFAIVPDSVLIKELDTTTNSEISTTVESISNTQNESLNQNKRPQTKDIPVSPPNVAPNAPNNANTPTPTSRPVSKPQPLHRNSKNVANIRYADYDFPLIFTEARTYTKYIDTVKIESGSRLTWIAKKHYGSKDFWVYIYEANRDKIKNPDNLMIGMTIYIPYVSPKLVDASSDEAIKYAKYLHDLYLK